MPCAQIVRVFDLAEEERKEEDRRWILGAHVSALISYHALTADGDVPMTKADQKKRPNDAKVRKAKKAREKHDREWLDALSDPKAFGKLIGYPQILGEPERKKPKDDDLKEQRRRAFEGFKARYSQAMREHRR